MEVQHRALLFFFFFFFHEARLGCLASGGAQQLPVGGTEGDQVSDGSSWIPYIWDISREARHYGPALPLARPRQSQESNEPELLFAVWESPPILAKEGLTEEEAVWVPDVEPLQAIKENYVFGSREFDHHFGLSPRPTVGHVAPHATPLPPSPPLHNEIPTPHKEVPTPNTPAPVPHTDTTPYTLAPIPHTDTPYTDAPTPYTPLHAHPFPSHDLHPLKYVLPLRRRPRKYFLAGSEEDKHEEPSRSGLFRKYYIDPASKGVSRDPSYNPSILEQPPHPHYFSALPPLTYPHPHSPPPVRQYFLQSSADQEPHDGNLTSFEVYEKLRKTRTVDTQARTSVVLSVPKATSWVSFTPSSSSGRHQP